MPHKRTRRYLVVFGVWLLLIGLGGCGSMAGLNQYGSQVTVADIEPLHCEEIGRFLGRGAESRYAINNLLNIVGERGGDHVYIIRLEEMVGGGGTFLGGNTHTAYGYGFNCRNQS